MALLQPGVSIKPVMTETDVETILCEIYGLRCASIKQLNGYDDNNYYVQVKETCDNKNIKSLNKDGYVFKVVNSLDSKKPLFFEAQNEVLICLGKAGICCPTPIPDKNGQYYSVHTLSSGLHIIRLLAFIKGLILHEISGCTHLFFQCGQYVAKLNEVLKNFTHPGYDDRKSVWQLESVPQLSQFLFAITDESKRKIVESVIQEFTTKVAPICNQLEKGLIHGDFNEQNILVEKINNDWHIKGVLDFGDSHYSCYVFEVAITMTYMIIQGKDIDVGGHVLAGYNSIRRLSEEELNLLKTCVAARLCQSLVLGAYSHLQDPENPYILVTAKAGWSLLEKLWAQPENELLERWKRIMNTSSQ